MVHIEFCIGSKLRNKYNSLARSKSRAHRSHFEWHAAVVSVVFLPQRS